ncbi:O-methyltransferase [Demequina sp.]|uniref:O-methyltransferase n=1 Tax=Demequina sp. TaxID=2050685 RepID=UPI0025C18E72|nr:O-methyltransferase [Demequina sp.]
MTVDPALTAFADEFAGEDDILLAARDAADEWGVDALSPGTGATLTVIARACNARAVVEIGTGVGVSGVYLVRGMAPGGILTSIDVEPEHHRSARATFAAAGFAPERTRLITGRALDVLPRLTDAGYDLVLVDGRRTEFPDYVEQAVRLTRAGGIIVMAHALGHGRVADPTQRDPETTAIREAVRAVRGAEGLTACLVPVGDGLLIASVDA